MKRVFGWSLLVVVGAACARRNLEQSHGPATGQAPMEMHQGQPAQPGESAPMAWNAAPPLGARAVCPVTKEVFTVTPRTQSAQYRGKTYMFCCADCKPDFENDPERYVRAGQAKTAPPAPTAPGPGAASHQ